VGLQRAVAIKNPLRLVRKFMVPILSRTVIPGIGQRNGGALVGVFAVIAVAAVLVGFACEGAHTGANSTSDKGTFGSTPEDGAENGSAGTSDESAFSWADASPIAVVMVAVAIIAIVVGMVALSSAVKVIVALSYGGGCEWDQHHEGQGCACDAVRD
jgi:hypothetical protein